MRFMTAGLVILTATLSSGGARVHIGAADSGRDSDSSSGREAATRNALWQIVDGRQPTYVTTDEEGATIGSIRAGFRVLRQPGTRLMLPIVLQRLRVSYGEHDVEIYREGYRPVRQKMLFRPGETYRIKQGMEPVATGEQTQPRPVPSERPREQRPDPRGRVSARPGERAPDRPDRNDDDFGSLAIRVQPDDAIVTIDGERWDRPEGDARLLVELSEGMHRIEVRKDGYKPYVSTVRVRRGDTVTVNVSLPQGE